KKACGPLYLKSGQPVDGLAHGCLGLVDRGAAGERVFMRGGGVVGGAAGEWVVRGAGRTGGLAGGERQGHGGKQSAQQKGFHGMLRFLSLKRTCKVGAGTDRATPHGAPAEWSHRSMSISARPHKCGGPAED